MHNRRLHPVTMYIDDVRRAAMARAAEAQGLSRTEYLRRIVALHLDLDAAMAPLPWRVAEVERRIKAVEDAVGVHYTPALEGTHELTDYRSRPRAPSDAPRLAHAEDGALDGAPVRGDGDGA